MISPIKTNSTKISILIRITTKKSHHTTKEISQHTRTNTSPKPTSRTNLNRSKKEEDTLRTRVTSHLTKGRIISITMINLSHPITTTAVSRSRTMAVIMTSTTRVDKTHQGIEEIEVEAPIKIEWAITTRVVQIITIKTINSINIDQSQAI